MYYVQYFDKTDNGGWVEVLGDRGVVVLDGRNRLEVMKEDAVVFNGYRRPKFDGYQICKGRGFSDSKPITKVIRL